MSNTFVNEAFTQIIEKYLNSKNNPEGIEYNSFLVVIVRLLTIIYDELDILTPYYLRDEQSLNNNLTKYGYNLSEVLKFKNLFNSFYEKESEESFVKLQKMIIDMFAMKKITYKVTQSELDEFKKLIFSPHASNPLVVSYNFLMAKNPLEVYDYFEKTLKGAKKAETKKPRETLNLEAYEILKYSLEDIYEMSSEELSEVNKKVYSFFDVNENAINKKYLLDKAVYNFNNPKPAFSTGNGYVDILFFMALLATVGMVVLILTLVVF